MWPPYHVDQGGEVPPQRCVRHDVHGVDRRAALRELAAGVDPLAGEPSDVDLPGTAARPAPLDRLSIHIHVHLAIDLSTDLPIDG